MKHKQSQWSLWTGLVIIAISIILLLNGAGFSASFETLGGIVHGKASLSMSNSLFVFILGIIFLIWYFSRRTYHRHYEHSDTNGNDWNQHNNDIQKNKPNDQNQKVDRLKK